MYFWVLFLYSNVYLCPVCLIKCKSTEAYRWKSSINLLPKNPQYLDWVGKKKLGTEHSTQGSIRRQKIENTLGTFSNNWSLIVSAFYGLHTRTEFIMTSDQTGKLYEVLFSGTIWLSHSPVAGRRLRNLHLQFWELSGKMIFVFW